MADAEHFEPLLTLMGAAHQTQENHRLQEEFLRVDGVAEYRAHEKVGAGVLSDELQGIKIERPLSAAELAPMIGLHSVTILRWAREGRIPHHRLSARKIVFLPSEIRHWLANGSGLYAVRVGHAA
jgi:predicted DNA-binding transcriptional regulator AlpA